MESHSENNSAVSYGNYNPDDLMKRIVEVSNCIANKTKSNKTPTNHDSPLFAMPYDEVMSWEQKDINLFWNMCVQASAGNDYIVVGSNGAVLYNKCVDYVREHGWCKFDESFYYYMIKDIADVLIEEL